jgi:hypothetical protein
MHTHQVNKGIPRVSIGFQQTLPRSLQYASQAMQVVQTSVITELRTEVLLDEKAYPLPVPARQLDACRFRYVLNRRLQLSLLPRAEDGEAASLLKGQTGRTLLAQAFNPITNCLGIPLQSLSHLGGGSTSGQKPERMPAFSFSWCWCPIHAFPHRVHIQIPANRTSTFSHRSFTKS